MKWCPLLLAVGLGCSDPMAPFDQEMDDHLRLALAIPRPAHSRKIIIGERNGPGRLAYLGFDVDPAKPTDHLRSVQITHYLEATTPFSQNQLLVVELRTSTGNAVSTVHIPLEGRIPVKEWRPGQIWADRQSLDVPEHPDALSLWVGIAASDATDKDRIASEVGRLFRP